MVPRGEEVRERMKRGSRLRSTKLSVIKISLGDVMYSKRIESIAS